MCDTGQALAHARAAKDESCAPDGKDTSCPPDAKDAGCPPDMTCTPDTTCASDITCAPQDAAPCKVRYIYCLSLLYCAVYMTRNIHRNIHPLSNLNSPNTIHDVWHAHRPSVRRAMPACNTAI